ncbi:MAG: hypothetical protein R2862_12310 [Thermoanaerobaculia bacterium]
MRDGSDAIADWPLLNAMINAERRDLGLDPPWRGVGIGASIHAGMVIVADGTVLRRARARPDQRPRHGRGAPADAGYPEALACAAERGVDLPMLRPESSDT